MAPYRCRRSWRGGAADRLPHFRPVRAGDGGNCRVRDGHCADRQVAVRVDLREQEKRHRWVVVGPKYSALQRNSFRCPLLPSLRRPSRLIARRSALRSNAVGFQTSALLGRNLYKLTHEREISSIKLSVGLPPENASTRTCGP